MVIDPVCGMTIDKIPQLILKCSYVQGALIGLTSATEAFIDLLTLNKRAGKL
jgi:hypothetical protein